MPFVLEVCNPSSEENIYINKTEEELIDYLIEVHNPELNDEEIKAFKEEIKDHLKDSLYWSSLTHLLSSLREYQRYVSVFPQVSAACLALSYALIVHPILFSNWRWKDTDDIDLSRLDLNLSSKDIYGELQKCNPDVVSVFISKLEDCSQADKEILQDAFEGGQRDVFIEKLKALSTSDYNSLALVTAFSHLGNVLVSGDLDTLEILLYHIDYLDDFKPEQSLLPGEEWMEMRNEAYWEKYSFGDDMPEEKAVANMDAMREKMESYLAMVRRVCFAYLKYKIPGALSSINPFPFERKYLDDVLNYPGVKSILDELPEKPFESEMAPDKQEQPEVKVVALLEGQKKSKAGNKPKPWIKVSLTEPVIKRKLEEEVWTGIVDDIHALDFCDKSEIEKGKASKAFGAALIFYSAHSLGLTDEKLFNLPASRAFNFLPAPKTSVNLYLKRLYGWYDKLINAGISKKGNLDEKTLKKWKSEDSFRANFIIKNFEAIKDLVKKATFLLGKAFGVETGLEYESPEIGSDPVLGGALLYNDEVNNKDDGSKILTGLPLSDSYNKQLGK
jgi:hypothetical protein